MARRARPTITALDVVALALGEVIGHAIAKRIAASRRAAPSPVRAAPKPARQKAAAAAKVLVPRKLSMVSKQVRAAAKQVGAAAKRVRAPRAAPAPAAAVPRGRRVSADLLVPGAMISYPRGSTTAQGSILSVDEETLVVLAAGGTGVDRVPAKSARLIEPAAQPAARPAARPKRPAPAGSSSAAPVVEYVPVEPPPPDSLAADDEELEDTPAGGQPPPEPEPEAAVASVPEEETEPKSGPTDVAREDQ